MQTTFDKVKEIIISDFGTEPEAITKRAKFIQDLHFDSLDVIELIMTLEQEFDIAINETDLENGKDITVNKMCSIVDEIIAKKK